MMTKTLITPLPSQGLKKKVVIIGAGVTGALTAWELARAGHNVTVLEARQVGSGSSSRSAACIRQQFSTPSTVRGMRYCVSFYDQWRKLMNSRESPIRYSGYLFLTDYSVNPDDIKERVNMQREAGLAEVQWLSRDELDKQFPHLETTGIQGATWCPTDGFLLPHVVYNDSVQAARRLGAQIIQDVEVTSVNKEGDNIVSVVAKDGTVYHGDIFINATNAWAPRISAMCDGYELPISTRRRYLYILEGLKSESIGLDPSDVQRLPMTITPRGCFCRPESTQQLMMGWLHFAQPIDADFEDQDRIEPGFSNLDFDGYGMAVRKELTTYIPALEDMGRIQAVACGYYADTKDHNPLIGFDPLVPNLLHVAGFSGHGLMHAPFSARIATHLVAEGHNLSEMDLPDLGTVNLSPYEVDREPASGESMVI